MSSDFRQRRIIVITGASSGIGRATALAFAADRHLLVLAARDATSLSEVAGECSQLGSRVEICPTDVSDEQQVEALASHAITAFGRIDVWLNCAAVLAFAPLEVQSSAIFRRVIDVNLMGTVHGSQAAIERFKTQGNRGTLINVASMLSLFAEPYLGAYVASKFAIRGFTASLRQEMARLPHVHVCTVLPVAIDTPIYQKAANLTGTLPRSIAPLYGADIVARTIVKLAKHPKAETIAGHYGYLLDILNRLSPALVSSLSAWLAPKVQFETASSADTDGNLFESRGPYSVEGGWRQYWKHRMLRRRWRAPPPSG